MAAAKICDSCGEFFKYNPDDNTPNGISFTHYNETGKAIKRLNKVELCPDCLAKIQNDLKLKEV